MYVIATAGHVDHGKSALVRTLTGIDPDRWEEERRRGLTIDLGYAWLTLPSGREVALVDVPGHERFIKNMLAGAGAVNAAIFIVASNEGWKPQSQEHLHILHLLGISTAVVVLTKTDLVDRTDIETLTHQVRDRLAGTTLEHANILPVSAHTGDGIEDLKHELDALLTPDLGASDLGRPRLWIDRVFSMKGAGTVVTGTLSGGRLSLDDEVEIFPTAIRTRVRAMQSHQRGVTSAGPGSRVALNLTTVQTEDIQRGHVVGLPDSWLPTKSVAASLTLLPQITPESLSKGAFKLHVGSAETDISIRILQSAERQFALIRAEDALVLDVMDRVVLRDVGRRATVAGAVVLDPHFEWERRKDPRLIELLQDVNTPQSYIAYLTTSYGPQTLQELRLKAGADTARVEGVKVIGNWAMATTDLGRLSGEVEQRVRAHQDVNPMEPGMPRTALRSSLGIDAKVFEALMDELIRVGGLLSDGVTVRTPDFEPQASDEERKELVGQLTAADASPPAMRELYARFEPALIKSLISSGDLVQITPEFAFLQTTLNKIKAQVRDYVSSSGPMTVAQFRDLVGTTRKYAVPLLEYLDRTGFTRRDGDVRSLGPRADQDD